MWDWMPLEKTRKIEKGKWCSLSIQMKEKGEHGILLWKWENGCILLKRKIDGENTGKRNFAGELVAKNGHSTPKRLLNPQSTGPV